jgi:serine/threonine-protein kinase HipA
VSERQLNIYVNQVLMGTLKANNNIWSFKYESTWIQSESAFSLCPDIPLSDLEQIDGSSERPIQHFFDNLLPEENARILLAKDLGVKDVKDTFLLLEKSGNESAGALTITSSDIVFPKRECEKLTYAELNERIKNLPKAPLNHKKQKRMSLAGAQHKMLVILQGTDIYEPNVSMPSTHILKPDHSEPDKYWQSTMNEWFVMSLAGKMGLNVPDVKVLYTPAPVYLIERFDRSGEYPEHQRTHIIDACQLLGLDKLAKYPLSKVETYVEIVNSTRSKAITMTRLFDWVLFNLLIGNGDAHLKNLSFFQVDSGAALTPFYDLLSTLIYETNSDVLRSEMSVPLGDKTLFCDVKMNDVEKFASNLGLPIKVARRATQRILSEITPQFDVLYQQVENGVPTPQKGGELRMLREIKYKVLAPMVKQLSL